MNERKEYIMKEIINIVMRSGDIQGFSVNLSVSFSSGNILE
jgi:hypothetical protein